jgi:D-alanyl-lipoteichoic acid acyltransferase DltB (MBOAT superfamily)
MLFQTSTFFLFFAVVFALYVALRRSLAWQNRMLLVASYVFYAWWDVRFLILIVGGTAFAYILGPAVAEERISARQLRDGLGLAAAGALASFLPHIATDWKFLLLVGALMAGTAALAAALNAMPAARRGHAAMVAGIVANLCLLGYFKYFNFFADSFVHIVELFGGRVTWTTANIVLPIGISFFTFQKIAYLIDIRRRTFEPSRDILTFASFVAFFPQLVAGPIERPHHLYPQMLTARTVTADKLASGAMLFVWGMYKKVVIADNMAPVVNDVFARAGTATTGDLLVGILAFAFQIYGDFSGYTDMARGVARMLGFNLMLNFNLPYFSRTPSEFWERWHISLSSWLRDYLYISLGGNRGGAVRTYRNLFLTMLLGGLWHGANWTFVAWGGFHGAILILYRLANVDRRLMPRVNGWMATSPATGLLANALLVVPMFALTLIGWLFFRAPDMATVGHYFSGLFRSGDFSSSHWGDLALFTLPLVAVQCWQRATGKLEFLAASPWFLRFNLLLFLVCSLAFLAPHGASDFIYFAF